MVRGRGIAVTAVACTYPCADTTRIARGRGTASPKTRQASVYRFFSSAFIGLPWPKNAAGMTVLGPPPSAPPPPPPPPPPRAPPPARGGGGEAARRCPGGGRSAARRGREPAGAGPVPA